MLMTRSWEPVWVGLKNTSRCARSHPFLVTQEHCFSNSSLSWNNFWNNNFPLYWSFLISLWTYHFSYWKKQKHTKKSNLLSVSSYCAIFLLSLQQNFLKELCILAINNSSFSLSLKFSQTAFTTPSKHFSISVMTSWLLNLITQCLISYLIPFEPVFNFTSSP